MKAPTTKGKYFEELQEGDTFVSQARKITETDILTHAGHGGDFYQLHLDDEFALERGFRGRILHGFGSMAICGGFMYQSIPHQGMIIAHIGGKYSLQNPVYVGDTIHGEHTVLEKRPSRSKPDRGILTFRNIIRKQTDEVVLEVDITFLWARAGV